MLTGRVRLVLEASAVASGGDRPWLLYTFQVGKYGWDQKAILRCYDHDPCHSTLCYDSVGQTLLALLRMPIQLCRHLPWTSDEPHSEPTVVQDLPNLISSCRSDLSRGRPAIMGALQGTASCPSRAIDAMLNHTTTEVARKVDTMGDWRGSRGYSDPHEKAFVCVWSNTTGGGSCHQPLCLMVCGDGASRPPAKKPRSPWSKPMGATVPSCPAPWVWSLRTNLASWHGGGDEFRLLQLPLPVERRRIDF